MSHTIEQWETRPLSTRSDVRNAAKADRARAGENGRAGRAIRLRLRLLGGRQSALCCFCRHSDAAFSAARIVHCCAANVRFSASLRTHRRCRPHQPSRRCRARGYFLLARGGVFELDQYGLERLVAGVGRRVNAARRPCRLSSFCCLHRDLSVARQHLDAAVGKIGTRRNSDANVERSFHAARSESEARALANCRPGPCSASDRPSPHPAQARRSTRMQKRLPPTRLEQQ